MSDEKNNFQNRSWSDRDGFGQSRFSFLNFTQSIIFILLCLGTFSIFADEQDRRYDSKNLYDPPLVKITEQDLNGLRQSLQDPSKDSISEIQKVLGQYYSQFIDSRRIEEEKRLGKIFDENTNRNTIRLLILNMFSKLTPSGMMRDSPILFELHMLLSKEYDKKNKMQKRSNLLLLRFVTGILAILKKSI
ncbi:hypothetical protein LEP1GSC115_0121 [Leptospira interrogans serovar Australis str. 200703203]|uniref:Uncharacterized protein n=1 Tax=Leptospira interrogans serovar Australis str. 200703203 TaxID=1085541 RepID=N1UMY2_LEPIR|nr:hypothetical protein LEP1GSC115_0121 [Leptospira interrogans serovar Australis str. 200703203]